MRPKEIAMIVLTEEQRQELEVYRTDATE
jgi:hypothetical protein